MAELKTKENDGSVSAFLNGIEHEQRKADCEELLNIMEQVTGEQPRMWGKSMVGFGSYHYTYDSGREGDWFRVGFSPRKQNLTIYFLAGFEELSESMEGLGTYKTGKSCLYVKKLSDLDQKKLKIMIRSNDEIMKKSYKL